MIVGRTPLAKNTTKIRANSLEIFAIQCISIITFREHSTKEDVRKLLQKFKRANPRNRLIIVLDNFRSHHVMLVKNYAASNNIQIVHLPPYSSDLNPID
jgi:putative transposase